MNTLFLTTTSLFQGSTEEEVRTMLACLDAYTKCYAKGETVCRAGEPVKSMGLVLSGIIHIEQNDVWGNKSLLSQVETGQIFAETYAFIPEQPLMVDVIAVAPAEVLFLHASRLVQTCPRPCSCHGRLIRNLLQILAQKNLTLSRRILHTSSKSIRGRLLSYLSQQALHHNSYQFTIPFNRQQLADYLGVDRSALSNELSRMQRDGLISCQRNSFCLKQFP